MDPDLLLTEDSDTLAERLFKEHVQVNVPRLLHDQRYRDRSQEVDIRPHGFTSLTADMIEAGLESLNGTRITIHLPFKVHPFLFKATPATRDTASPPRVYRIQEDELLIVYETTETGDPGQVTSALNGMVEDIERYLGWVEHDGSRYHLTSLEGTRKAVVDRLERLLQNRSLEESLVSL